MSRLGSDIKEMFQEQREFRELLVVMTRRDLMLRYKQTIMGFGWAVFMPLLNTILFSVIFAKVAKDSTSSKASPTRFSPTADCSCGT